MAHLEEIADGRELAHVLDEQAATAEILRLVGRVGPTAQPVLDAIAAAALRLLGGACANVLTVDAGLLHVAALATDDPQAGVAVREMFPRPPGRDTAAGRAVLARDVVAIPHVLADPDSLEGASVAEVRSAVGVPVMREDVPIGAIEVGRRGAGPFSAREVALLRTFAEQAAIALGGARLFNVAEARSRELADSVDQQQATSEILRVISRSPSEVPFDKIVTAAKRLCSASAANMFTFDGELLHVAALTMDSAEGEATLRRHFPRPPSRGMAASRAVLTRRVVAIHDTKADPEYEWSSAERWGFRSVLCVPLLREGTPIGAIAVGRPNPGPFPESQVALLQTFADQAVIAIENVRLFKELGARNQQLAESVEEQKATGEILSVISRSPGDVRPVFETIVASATRLCESNFALVMLHESGWLSLGAHTPCTPEFADYLARGFPVSRETTAGRAALEHKPVQIADFMAEPGIRVTPAHEAERIRTVMSVPMLRDDRLLGVINTWRRESRPFTPRQIALLQTFAAQAVIAIENARLFAELEARNRELTEAVEEQKATSEILRVISRSPTDVQPVYDTIVASAAQLCEAYFACVMRHESGWLSLAARTACTPELGDYLARGFPVDTESVSGRASLARKPVQLDDRMAEPGVPATPAHQAENIRTVMSVPMLRGDELLGVITLWRREVRPFTQKQIALLQTFADQAVIAIENVRLFKELETRNRELTEAVEQQTATSEILRVISRSPTEVPFETIVAAARRLCGAAAANMFTFDGKLLHVGAMSMDSPEGEPAARRYYPRPPDRATASSRAVLTRGLVQIHDTTKDPDYRFESAERFGFRSVVCIPLMREGTPIGAIAIGRREPGPFPHKQIALLQTFADQAVIAIENVRLFKELAARTTELARSVERMRALGEVGQAVSSTLDLETVLSTIVSRATQLASMDGGAIYEYEEARREFRVHATHELPDELVDALRATPIPSGEGAVGRLATSGEPVAIGDITDEAMYQSRAREILLRLGYRSLLAVPLLREDRLLGGLVVNRKVPGEFAPDVVDLLKTFAIQSALAIQNARLYREIEEKSRQLEVASRHKSAFLANMSHELRTPLNAIIGFTRIVMRRSQERLEPKQYENLEKILFSAQNLLSLINAVLDLAKVEAGRTEVNPSEVRLAAVLDACMRTVEPLVKEGVTQERAFDGELPTMAVDEEKLRQILINLLSNAAKFTSSGSIRVRARAENGSIVVAVADTGIGIPADKLELIFEEFEQAHGGTTREHGGTGLGLAIARRLARLLGGDIRVESAPGAGSTFTLTLPIRYRAPSP